MAAVAASEWGEVAMVREFVGDWLRGEGEAWGDAGRVFRSGAMLLRWWWCDVPSLEMQRAV
jgi:hypothetical protein